MNEDPRSTRSLLELIQSTDLAVSGPVLDVGSHEGAVARFVGGTYANVDLSACEAARAAGAGLVLHTDALPEGPFTAIAFDARDYDPGLAAETVAAAAARLSPDGLLLTTAPAKDVALRFGQVWSHGDALVARSPLPSARAESDPDWKAYEAEFAGQTYRFLTAPGVFAPRGMDEGTRLMLSQIQAAPETHFLDLGSGVGVVSRIASEAWGCRVTAVDVNARALRLTHLNAPDAEVLASDGFGGLSGRQFDIIASNPPYHTDFAVAKAFIEGAHAHLTPGGSLFLVVKRADWYVQKVRNVFGGCRVTQENGYTVIAAERREPRSRARPGETQPATTRKHAKRLEAASRKRVHRPR